MKNKKNIILLVVTAVVLAAIIISAAVLYPKLSEKYSADAVTESTTGEIASKTESVKKTADFTVYDAERNKVHLSDYFEKPIVVNFWATWCGSCKSELPAFNKMYEKYKDDVVFLMVNLPDSPNGAADEVKQFTSANGYSFPVYFDFDNNAARVYGVYSIPETLFINADGSLNRSQIGAMSEDILENQIKQILEESK